jgi:hypothetical protein
LLESSPRDQAQIVAFLASESRQPVADVAKVYEQECAVLVSRARITNFLHIFAIRNVQEILRTQALADGGAEGYPTDRRGSTRPQQGALADRCLES